MEEQDIVGQSAVHRHGRMSQATREPYVRWGCMARKRTSLSPARNMKGSYLDTPVMIRPSISCLVRPASTTASRATESPTPPGFKWSPGPCRDPDSRYNPAPRWLSDQYSRRLLTIVAVTHCHAPPKTMR